MFRLRAHARGFTLIELMVAIAVVAILAAIALPSYTAYIKRSRIPPGLDALSSFAVRMEQKFQDDGGYTKDADSACALAPPSDVDNYTITCSPRPEAKDKLGYVGFTAKATGTGVLSGYEYTIDDTGARITTKHPGSVPGKECWSIKGGVCDS